jgi:hypothetical protein
VGVVDSAAKLCGRCAVAVGDVVEVVLVELSICCRVDRVVSVVEVDGVGGCAKGVV